MNVAIVIPALNEVATIRTLAQRACGVAGIVIVVDDGSTDGTAAALDGTPVVLVRHPHNLGKAASLWDGLQLALAKGADVVVTMDGDGQHDVADVPRLVRALAAHPSCVAIGARVRYAGPAPRGRRIANRLADFWVSWAAGHRVLDSQSGQRAYPAALLQGLALPHGPARAFTLESELLIEAARRGFRTVAVPIDAVYGTSARPSHFRPWRDIPRIAQMIAGRLFRGRLQLSGLVESLRSGPTVHDPAIGEAAAFVDAVSRPRGAD
ncbi:MAG: glycosyltransferase family 2 protein [Betaproteobacteria bacterium]